MILDVGERAPDLRHLPKRSVLRAKRFFVIISPPPYYDTGITIRDNRKLSILF